MKVVSLRTYCCLRCHAMGLTTRIDDVADRVVEIVKGVIYCPHCQANYPVRNGVPRFVPDEEYAGSFGFQWNKFRRTQLDSHTGVSVSADRLFQVTKWPRIMLDSIVLEAGSGAGRFSEVLLATGATVFSFDLSCAVDANLQNNGHLANLNLFQASIFDIPLPETAFDKVICLGVLQHTPDPGKAFASLARHVKPGGEIAIDVYAWRFRALLSWKYLLRPITTRIPKEKLLCLVKNVVRVLLPVTIFLRKIGGRVGARLTPIVEYSHFGLPYELNREWAILDTFDMYSPEHDHPQSLADVRRWFNSADFENVVVEYGPNGVIGRGRRPLKLMVGSPKHEPRGESSNGG